jgi:hypothetical protein
MYQSVDGKDKHVFGRFTTGTLVNPKEHASFIIMDGGPAGLFNCVCVSNKKRKKWEEGAKPPKAPTEAKKTERKGDSRHINAWRLMLSNHNKC